MIRTFLMSDPMVQRLGWVLVHSLWEGALVALLLARALHLLRRRSPDARYALSCAALALLAALPVLNFVLVPRVHPPTTVTATLSNAGALAPETVTAVPLPEGADIALSFATEPAPPALPEAPATAPRPGVTWTTVRASVERVFPWLVGAWALGVAVLSVQHLGGWVRVRRIRRSHTRPLEPRWEKTLARLARRLGVTRPVRLLESALVQVPAVVGWLRPVILVPASAVSGLSPREMEAILAHELAHVRRHDYLVNVLQAVVETVLF